MPTLLAVLALGCRSTPDPIERPDPTDPTGTPTTPIDADADGSVAGVDCDDGDATVYPGAPDVCGDDRVTDCDRTSDDGLVTLDGDLTTTDLAEAFSMAGPGAEIRVCPGTYRGPFRSTVGVDLVAHAGPESTTLDGGGLGTTLSVPGNTRVTGFTIVGGRGDTGGGLALFTGGALEVADCVVRGNVATLGGGLAVPAGANVVVSGARIFDNEADHGGGFYAIGSTVDLASSQVFANRGVLSGGGGALADATLIGGALVGNRVVDVSVGPLRGGGGLSGTGSCEVIGTDIGENRAFGGGGLSFASGTLRLIDVSVHDNRLSGMGSGGGVWVLDGALLLEGTSEVRANRGFYGGGVAIDRGEASGGRIVDNVASLWGGGLYVVASTVTGITVAGNQADTGGGLMLFGDVRLVDLEVDGNTADNGAGLMAFQVRREALVSVVGGVWTNNTARLGGAMYDSIGTLEIDGARLEDNLARDGGALYLSDGIVRVIDSTVVRNTATEKGGGAYIFASTLSSDGTDWGTDADDNTPHDVAADEVEYTGYGSVTFGCEDEVCTPLP